MVPEKIECLYGSKSLFSGIQGFFTDSHTTLITLVVDCFNSIREHSLPEWCAFGASEDRAASRKNREEVCPTH